MARKIPDSELRDAVERYLSGMSAKEAVEGFPFSSEPLLRYLREHGLVRKGRELHQFAAARSAEARRVQLPKDEIIAAYRDGMSQNALAERHGVTRGPIRRILLESGVELRGQAEANQLHLSQRTPEQRKKWAKKAHEASRGFQSLEHRCAIAKGRERKQSGASEYERRLAAWLEERGLHVILQKAIGPYNTDIGAYPVAVEVFGGNWHAYGDHASRLSKRTRYILDQGWNLVIIWVNERRRKRGQVPLQPAAADYIVSFAEEARRNPSLRGQYRVIWGDGKVVPTDGMDIDDLALVPSRHRSHWPRT